VYQSLLAWGQGRGLPVWIIQAIWMFFLAAIVIVFILVTALILAWLERRLSARMQGPTGGRFGLLQPAADALKLLQKEDLIPRRADRPLFRLAPVLVFVPVLVAFIVIPFSGRWIVRDLNLGVVFVLAVLAFHAIGLFIAGWASNSKYALLGAVRAVGQSLSYNIPLMLALACVVVPAGSLRLGAIVEAQRGGHWLVLRPPLQLAFLVYMVAAIAQTRRTPFDSPEAEAELVGGYRVEYSGVRFGIFLLADHAHLFFVSVLCVTLFFGGWHGPWLPPALWFLVKTYAVILAIMWVQRSVPRLRIDQSMAIAWKLLIPVGLAAVLLTGLVQVL
jgi:NADH-quinone oxidoreductase subunit H